MGGGLDNRQQEGYNSIMDTEHIKEKKQTRSKSRLIHFRMTPELHTKIRVRVAIEDISIQKWVERLIEKELQLPHPQEPEGGKP